MTIPPLEDSVQDIAAPPNNPQVSVIIAAYNCAPYLASAIESALNQDGVNVEVLVVDDASTDGTAEVARRYENIGPVRVLVNEVNRGPSFSRNRAIRAARGDWVAQLDGDDWFGPGRLAALLQLGISRQADFVADDLFVVEDSTLKEVSTRFLDSGVPWRTAQAVGPLDLIRYDLGSIKPLARRAFLVEHSLAYAEDVKYGEDFLLLLKAMLAGARVMVLPHPMYHLRRGNTGSLTTQHSHLFRQSQRTTMQLLADPEVTGHAELVTALRHRLRRVERLAMLEEVVRLAKQGKVVGAATGLLRDPKLVPVLLFRISEEISLRMRRRKLGAVRYRAHRPPCAGLPRASRFSELK